MSSPTLTANEQTKPSRRRRAQTRIIIGASIAAILILAVIVELFASGLVLIPTGSLPAPLAQTTLYVARQGLDLTALRASDGSVRWRYYSGGWYTAVSDGLVFTTSTDDASVFALRESDGSRAWTAHNIGDPLAAGDGVVIVVRFDEVDPTLISGLNTTDGSQRWSFNVVGVNRPYVTLAGSTVYVYGAGNGSATTDDTSTIPDTLYALRADDGTLLWKTAMTSTGSAPPAVGNGNVYVADNAGYVNALSASDGTPLWRVNIGSRGFGALSTLATGSGAVYAGSYDGYLIALNAADGTTLWRLRLSAASAPTASDGLIYVNTTGGELRVLNAADGTQRWSATVHGILTPFGNPRPLVLGGGVFEGVSGHCLLICRESYVYGLRASDGATAWRYDVPVQVTPMVVG